MQENQSTRYLIVGGLLALAGMLSLLYFFAIAEVQFSPTVQQNVRNIPVEQKEYPDPSSSGGCIVSGCSGQVCDEEALNTTCEFLPEYACYQKATCERQADGECGWTQTAELQECLADAPL